MKSRRQWRAWGPEDDKWLKVQKAVKAFQHEEFTKLEEERLKVTRLQNTMEARKQKEAEENAIDHEKFERERREYIVGKANRVEAEKVEAAWGRKANEKVQVEFEKYEKLEEGIAAMRQPVNCTCGSRAKVDSGLEALNPDLPFHRVVCTANIMCWGGPLRRGYDAAIDAWDEEMGSVKVPAVLAEQWVTEREVLLDVLIQLKEERERLYDGE